MATALAAQRFTERWPNRTRGKPWEPLLPCKYRATFKLALGSVRVSNLTNVDTKACYRGERRGSLVIRPKGFDTAGQRRALRQSRPHSLFVAMWVALPIPVITYLVREKRPSMERSLTSRFKASEIVSPVSNTSSKINCGDEMWEKSLKNQ
jgi:hypothetical protein